MMRIMILMLMSYILADASQQMLLSGIDVSTNCQGEEVVSCQHYSQLIPS